MVGAILGHSTVAATEVYAHLRALDGNPTAEIVPLRRA
jgi:hypothetical protein